MDNNLKKVFRMLDVDESNGLATGEADKDLSVYQKLIFHQAKLKLGVSAVYFLRDEKGEAKIPAIYFSEVDSYDPQKIAELHRLAWNMGQAPLLFVVTPDKLLIYNNYEVPKRINESLDPEAGLIEEIGLVNTLETERRAILCYNRTLLESGEYWRRSASRFDCGNRVDNTLLSNLKIIRKNLIHKIQKRTGAREDINVLSIVHGLLSRSILIKYLEERKDSCEQTVFPKDFFGQFFEGAKSYTDVLQSKEATYQLFDCLRKKFNGDMLPLVNNEIDVILEEDLWELRDFLLGNCSFGDNQYTLWPLYSFNVIPIQLISNIYELFFHLTEKEDDKGTYYTPLHLVDMLLDEIYPWEGEYQPVKVLDPACGSGIFLVEIYRRIVCRWMRNNNAKSVTNAQLKQLLEDSIYGIDWNEEAVRVASFSLSLAMCDFLEQRNIWEQLRFPKLKDKNLIVSDFFEEEIFEPRSFELIIGNPPWQSKLTEPAREYLNKGGKVIGDKQIAQAFAWKCGDLCADMGIVCLLMPSKGFLFNRSSKNKVFRNDFFKENTVHTVINFSAYRKTLFAHGTGPAVGIIYKPGGSREKSAVLYCTPKPEYTVEDSWKFVIEPNDICLIPSDIVNEDTIWKIAMWCGPRDYEIISKLQGSFCTLKEFMQEYGMSSAEGYKRGNRTKQCKDFVGYPIVTARELKSFYQKENELDRVDFIDYECVVKKKREIFEPPHLVIKQSHKGARFLAALLDYKAVFNHSILGIHGDSEKLKYLCLIINSKVFTYYHLMTNRKWMVERDELEAGDIWDMPIPVPAVSQLRQAVELFDRLKENKCTLEEMDKFVYSVYGLYDHEMTLINDAVDYIYDYYHARGKSKGFYPPALCDYHFYLDTFCEVLENSFGNKVIMGSIFFVGEAPLTILKLKMEGECVGTKMIHMKNQELISMLEELDRNLKEERQNVFIRRNVRIYKKDSIYIIKPIQLKYWNYSAACRDADDIFRDIMKTWRKIDE